MTQTQELLTDQRLVCSGTSWQQFKSIQAGFSDSPGIRLFYYKGTLELVSTSPEHEIFKSIIGYLITTFFIRKGIKFFPTGSMTQEREEVSAQADESYCLEQLKSIPDISVEIVFTSGGKSKLIRYRALGVREVWFWEDGLFTLYKLGAGGYDRINRSELVPDLDFELLTRCVLMNSIGDAAVEFERAIGQS
ncbi:MAG: Uma2 family endonuclease [Oscillatoriaceae cyanobacterium Prado104]|nr:Uma2 family endonuclease [Oscillatoriaceae cyanobacterium Prado104]